MVVLGSMKCHFWRIDAYTGSLTGNQAIIEFDANVLQQTYGGQNIGASQVTLTNVEYVSFYDNQQQVSQRIHLRTFSGLGQPLRREEVPMTYDPLIENVTVGFDSTTGIHTLSVVGSGISNADDFKSINVSLHF